MEIKLGELVNSVEAMNKLLKLELPIAESFKIAKLVKNVDAEISIFNEKRQALFKKHGTEKEGQIEVEEKNREQFFKELNELVSITIALDFEPVNISKLGDIKVEPATLLALDKFLK